LFLADSHRSHATKTRNKHPDKTKVDTIEALFHWYSTPPSSRANIRRTDAAKEINAPIKSMRFHVCLDVRLRKNTVDFP
jgi:hypothetical protein